MNLGRWICLFAWSFAACSRTMPAPSSQLARLAVQPEAQAGVAEVDITPPPGLGMFGHGPESRVAEGTLLRLRCHVFVFVGAQRAGGAAEALAFVPCELPAPSLLLQREVAERVNAAHLPLGADRIWIAATHTHAGPGHYFAADSFSGPMSSRRIGFDRAVVDFLAERIAQAVRDAFVDLKPARWGWTKSSEPGLSRNRSFRAFQRNAELPEELRQQLALPATDVTEAAVDRQLSVLRVEQRAGDAYQPRAALAIFGLHPTVIDASNTLYGGDAFGYATRALAGQLQEAHGRRVLVAMANGIEGDVTSIRRSSTPAEARRIGLELAARVRPLWERLGENEGAALDVHAAVSSRYRDLDLPGARVGDKQLCARPEIGTPLGGGADDHPTFWRVLDTFNPGVKRSVHEDACQSPKYILQGLGASTPGKTFPRVAPIGVASLGNGVLVTLPAEVTTVVGMRIRDGVRALAASLQLGPELVAVVGLTHEYIDYVASQDEYQAQRYEGASTLYGPWTGEFLRIQVECLARALWSAPELTGCASGQPHPVGTPASIAYHEGAFRAPWLARVPERAPGALALSAPRSTYTRDGALALETELRGVAPREVVDPSAFKLQVIDGSAIVDDEQGTNLRVRWDDDRLLWVVSWTPDVEADPLPCQRARRFRVFVGAKKVESAPGRLDCSSARATP